MVIIGAGFAGLEVAKRLGHAGIAVTVIDRRNHHLFQPLLWLPPVMQEASDPGGF
ncbi:FAD-dependent oxidoreductase [Paracoccus sp. (in: a-proteobacteria)]|uniref:FAD-dependent oxidoreductase n=1 Tax=Paracoccus sp. TaxID=267 RepID=UPI00272A3E77|nr:FAD-dependent oxidoreductase [Paracoccus sp. (in: a-proteobacteria)]